MTENPLQQDIHATHRALAGTGFPPNIGAQLIIWDEAIRTGLEQIAAFCAGIGYAYLEAPEMLLDVPAELVREVVTRRNIPLYAIHVGYPSISNPERLATILDYLRRVGTEVLISSGTASPSARDAYERSAEVLNAVGARCNTHGVRFYCHTHWWEYVPDDANERGIDVLLRNTDERYVRFNLDICWCQAGGADPLTIMREIGDRCDYYHVKDGILHKSWPPTVDWRRLGQGDVRIEPFLHSLHTQDRQCQVVVEQDVPYEDTPENDMEANIVYIKSFVSK